MIIVHVISRQAWHQLSSLQLSSRSYTKPGKTRPLTNDVSTFISQSPRQTTQQFQSDLKSTAAGQDQNNQIYSKGDVQTSEPNKSLGSCFPPHAFEVKEARQVVIRQKCSHSSTSDISQRETINGTASKSAVHASARNGPKSSFSDGIDDDDILEVIHACGLQYEHDLNFSFD